MINPNNYREFLLSFCFPLAIVLLSVVADSMTGGTTILGVVGIVVLGCMSFFLRPFHLCIWGAVLTGLFFHALGSGASESGDLRTVFIRVLTFVTGAIVCIIAATLRLRLVGARDDLLAILKNLPSPVLIADGNGTIQFVNQKMQDLLGTQGSNLVGGSFFSFFSDPQYRGQEISRFLNWIENGVHDESTESFTVLTDPPVRVHAVISTITFEKAPSLLVSVIDS